MMLDERASARIAARFSTAPGQYVFTSPCRRVATINSQYVRFAQQFINPMIAAGYSIDLIGTRLVGSSYTDDELVEILNQFSSYIPRAKNLNRQGHVS